jgi:hypothetical protein
LLKLLVFILSIWYVWYIPVELLEIPEVGFILTSNLLTSLFNVSLSILSIWYVWYNPSAPLEIPELAFILTDKLLLVFSKLWVSTPVIGYFNSKFFFVASKLKCVVS